MRLNPRRRADCLRTRDDLRSRFGGRRLIQRSAPTPSRRIPECGIGFGKSYLRRNAKSAALNFRIAPRLSWLRYTTETWNEQEFVQTRCTLIWLEVRPQAFLPEALHRCFEPSGDPATPSGISSISGVVETLRGEPNLFLRSFAGRFLTQKLQQINGSRVRNSYKSVSKKYLILPAIAHGLKIHSFVKRKNIILLRRKLRSILRIFGTKLAQIMRCLSSWACSDCPPPR